MTTPSWLSRSLRYFFVQFFWVFLGLFSVLYCAHLWMKCSFDISNFLKEISSLSLSGVFLHLFALFIEGFLVSSLLFSGTMLLVGCTFSFLPCFSLIFLQLFVKPPQTTTWPSCFSFSLGWFCLLPPVQYYGPLSIVLQALCLLDVVP